MEIMEFDGNSYLDFADDIALLLSNQQHAKEKITKLNQYAAQTGLQLNKKKTELLKINSRCNTGIQIDNHQLNEVDKYTNLGATVNEREGVEKDIKNRICKA